MVWSYVLNVHVSCPYACVFRFRSFASAHIIVLVHIRWFSFHTQRGQITDSACIARNKKRLASRLARSLRSQPVINKGFEIIEIFLRNRHIKVLAQTTIEQESSERRDWRLRNTPPSIETVCNTLISALILFTALTSYSGGKRLVLIRHHTPFPPSLPLPPFYVFQTWSVNQNVLPQHDMVQPPYALFNSSL